MPARSSNLCFEAFLPPVCLTAPCCVMQPMANGSMLMREHSWHLSIITDALLLTLPTTLTVLCPRIAFAAKLVVTGEVQGCATSERAPEGQPTV